MIKEYLDTNINVEEYIIIQIRKNQKDKNIDIIESILDIVEEHDLDVEELLSNLNEDIVNEIRVCAIKKRSVTTKFSKNYSDVLRLDQYNLME